MSKTNRIFWGAVSIFTLVFLCSCTKKEKNILDPQSPAVITLWHSYNAHAKTVFDDLVEEFNQTAGKEEGIIVNAYGYGDTDQIEDALYNSANRMIGSDPMPDIFTAYPDNAYRIDELSELVEMGEYFSEDERNEFREEFLEEGIFRNSETSKVIPVAKSTEVLYINKTDWDLFSADTGITVDSLATWEGIALAAEKYYKWSGGKTMCGFNPYNDFITMTAAQLGETPFVETEDGITFTYSRETAKKIWDIFYVPGIKGYYQSGKYCQDRIKSGKLLIYIGSSAGAGYFPSEIIDDSTNQHPAECMVIPYPTFQNAQSYMSQRGAGMCIVKSNEVQEYAAAEFLKWFTDTEQNIKFTAQTGYIPVKKEALQSVSKILDNTVEADNNAAVKESIKVTMDSIQKKDFISRKAFKGSYEVNTFFNESIFKKVSMDLEELQIRMDNGESEALIKEELISEENFDAWYTQMIQKVLDYLE